MKQGFGRSAPCTGIGFEAIGIFSGRFEYGLNTGSGPLDVSGNTTPLLRSICSDQVFSNLIEGNFLKIPCEDVPDPFRFFFDKADDFTYANITIAIFSRVCFTSFEPCDHSHLHPLYHPVQFHLSYPGTDRSDLGIKGFFYKQDFDLIILNGSKTVNMARIPRYSLSSRQARMTSNSSLEASLSMDCKAGQSKRLPEGSTNLLPTRYFSTSR